ncbi:MAG TPA: acyl-CoA dehydrogenase family protein [Longimicrobiales bacterium]
MARFKGVDYFDIESLLSEEERLVRDTVREWVDDHVLPVIETAYIERRFPRELIPQMAELGLLGANLPEEYGCAGLNNVAYGLIMQELERGDSGIRSFVSVQGALCMYPIYAFGSEEQKRHYLPRMARGEVIGCFGLTEPDFGSNPAGLITTARRDGDGWVLNGAKMWITNGSLADIAIIWAKTGDLDDPGSIRGFIVPTDTPGFTARDQKGKLSLLASDTSELSLQDVRVGPEALLPGTAGLKSALMCLTQARYGIAWGAIGAAMACFDEALRYAKERIQFGRPIAATQLQQERLANMLTWITQAQLLALRLGRLKDEGRLRPQQVSLAKRANVHMACEVAREARRLLGANGILVEYQAMRHMANLESVYTYEGTHDIHSLILGEDLTGFSAF